MSESEGSYGPRQGQFYTASRNVQQVLGKLPDGTYIWGGPYTIPQAVSGLVFFALAMGARSIGIWGGSSSTALLLDLLIAAVLAFGVVILVGKLPTPKRSLIGAVNGVMNQATAPKTGRWRGRSLPAPKKPKKQKETTQKESDTAEDESGAEVDNPIQSVKKNDLTCGLDLLMQDRRL